VTVTVWCARPHLCTVASAADSLCGSVPFSLTMSQLCIVFSSIIVFRSNVPRGEEELHAGRRDDVHARDQRCEEDVILGTKPLTLSQGRNP
jgi:hypothetical protein